MATTTNVCVETYIAGEDFRGDQYRLLQINSAGRVVSATAATNGAIGVLWEHIPTRDDDPTGRGVSVARLFGKLKMIAVDDQIRAGQYLVPAANGRVDGATTLPTSGGGAVGVALEDASTAGDVIQVAAQCM